MQLVSTLELILTITSSIVFSKFPSFLANTSAGLDSSHTKVTQNFIPKMSESLVSRLFWDFRYSTCPLGKREPKVAPWITWVQTVQFSVFLTSLPSLPPPPNYRLLFRAGWWLSFFACHLTQKALDENDSLKFNRTFTVSFAGIVPSWKPGILNREIPVWCREKVQISQVGVTIRESTSISTHISLDSCVLPVVNKTTFHHHWCRADSTS